MTEDIDARDTPKRMKHIHTLLLIVILATVITTSPAYARTVSITHSIDYKPYIFLDENGEAQGLIVDYWRLWAQKVNVEIKFVPENFQTCINMVRDGEADIVGGIFYNKERDQYLDFSEPFFDIDATLFVSVKTPAASPKDLIGTPVGVVKGDYSEWFIKTYHSKLSLQTYANYDDVIMAALQHKIKAFVLDRPNAIYLLSQHDALGKFRQLQTLYTQSLCGGVQLGNTELVSLINHGINQINDQEIREIYKKWVTYTPLFPKKLLRTIIILSVLFLFAILLLNTLVLRRRVKQKTLHLQKTLDSLHEKNTALTIEISEHKKTLQKKEKLANELKTISELIPICSNCKSIRDDNGYWEKVEVFIKSHTEVEFTHGICPKCIAELYPDIAKSRLPKK